MISRSCPDARNSDPWPVPSPLASLAPAPPRPGTSFGPNNRVRRHRPRRCSGASLRDDMEMSGAEPWPRSRISPRLSSRYEKPSGRAIHRKFSLQAIAVFLVVFLAASQRSGRSVAASRLTDLLATRDTLLAQRAHPQGDSSPDHGRPVETAGTFITICLRHAVANGDDRLSQHEASARRVVPAGLGSFHEWNPIDRAKWPCWTGSAFIA